MKATLDISRLQTQFAETQQQPPALKMFANEIIQDLQTALKEFTAVAEALKNGNDESED